MKKIIEASGTVLNVKWTEPEIISIEEDIPIYLP